VSTTKEITRKRYKEIQKALDKASQEIANRIKAARLRELGPRAYTENWFTHNRELERRIDAIVNALNRATYRELKGGSRENWDLSNVNNNALVKSYTKGMEVPSALNVSMNKVNLQALDAWLARKDVNGLTLSDRVWKWGNTNVKGNVETYLGSGLAQGKSAARLSRDVREALRNPNKLFRRVRDNQGRLVLSQNARAYHPGRGVYRSSYKNALRMTIDVNNQAYRTADFIRRQQLPFVVGIIVRLSQAHPRYDICDPLAGPYPAGFYFTGWHPLCICFTTSKLLPKKEFRKFLNTGKIDQRHKVRSIPQNGRRWLERRREQITGWKNLPTFMADNPEYFGDWLN